MQVAAPDSLNFPPPPSRVQQQCAHCRRSVHRCRDEAEVTKSRHPVEPVQSSLILSGYGWVDLDPQVLAGSKSAASSKGQGRDHLDWRYGGDDVWSGGALGPPRQSRTRRHPDAQLQLQCPRHHRHGEDIRRAQDAPGINTQQQMGLLKTLFQKWSTKFPRIEK